MIKHLYCACTACTNLLPTHTGYRALTGAWGAPAAKEGGGARFHVSFPTVKFTLRVRLHLCHLICIKIQSGLRNVCMVLLQCTIPCTLEMTKASSRRHRRSAHQFREITSAEYAAIFSLYSLWNKLYTSEIESEYARESEHIPNVMIVSFKDVLEYLRNRNSAALVTRFVNFLLSDFFFKKPTTRWQ